MRPGRSPRRRLSSAQRRAEILTAARELYADGTYADISVADIASAAGVSEALVYHYFGNKAGVYTEVVMSVTDELVANQVSAARSMSASTPVQDRIRTYIHAHLDAIQAFPKAWATPFTGGTEPAAATALRQQLREQYVAALDVELGDGSSMARIYALWGFLGFCEYAGVVWVVRGCPPEDRELIVTGAIAALDGSLRAMTALEANGEG